ncbi:MAG: hypothetical protein KatS3mg084_0177 [Candidatus Dojkabacteria bacterium]|nr:MAG: hypothetical protein KatS3mg084_0177 [Candidatus Dojkabacteria bacterium]
MSSNKYSSKDQSKKNAHDSGKTGVLINLLDKVKSQPYFFYASLVVVLVISVILGVVVYNTSFNKGIKFNKIVDIGAKVNEYTLGKELIKSHPFMGLRSVVDADKCAAGFVKLPAEPVISEDGTKLYFVEESNPREVKVMDVNKKVSVVYVAPDNYPFVASMALGPDGSLSYTLLERSPIDCNNPSDPFVAVRQMHIINGKELPVDVSPTHITQEIKYVFNNRYFATSTNFNDINNYTGDMLNTIATCLNPTDVNAGSIDTIEGIDIRRVVDDSLVRSFGGIVHVDKLSGEVYLYDGVGCKYKYKYKYKYVGHEVYKFNTESGNVEVVFGDDNTYIKEIVATMDTIIIRYSDRFDLETKKPIFDDLKTFEYKFNKNVQFPF